MFNATLSDVSLLRESLQGISELITEGTFEAKKDGLHLKAADPTMVAMIDFKFLSTLFESYKVDGAQKISVNVDNLLSVLKRAKVEDVVVFNLDNESNKLVITLKGSSTRKFSVPLIEIEESEAPEISLDFPAELEISGILLEEGIGDASVVTDTVILGASPEAFTMNAKGDTNQVEIKLDKGSKDLIGLNVKENIKSKYSLDYLRKMIKAAKLVDNVKVQLGNDYPMKLTFNQIDKLQISYVLAPRVED